MANGTLEKCALHGMYPGFNCTGQMGERFANVKDVNKVPHGGGGVMVWAGS